MCHSNPPTISICSRKHYISARNEATAKRQTRHERQVAILLI